MFVLVRRAKLQETGKFVWLVFFTLHQEMNATQPRRFEKVLPVSLHVYHLQMLKIPGTFRRKNKHAQLIAHVSI